MEHQLVLPGTDQNPNISGNLIAFEHFDAAAPTPNFEIYIYNLATDTIYRLTNTPEYESLNDISVAADGTVRAVWSRRDVTADDNVYAYTFQLPSADTTPPVLQLPAPITVDATGPAGAVVTYTATATDNADPRLAVVCTPSSGSTFAIGTTTVTCTATDASGNRTTGSFTVRVKGPAEQLSDLVALVQSFNLKQGITNSLDVKLQNALNAAKARDNATACNLLGALLRLHFVRTGKALTVNQATQLLAATQRIKAVLGCS